MSESQKKAKTMFDDCFKAYKNSSQYQDYARYDIAFNKSKYEETLDEMWRIYGKGVISQLPEYNKQLNSIKATGCKVYRNSQGKHKIVI